MSSMDSLAHLKIPLQDIKLATNNFSDENFIGVGGFGKVYKGELSRSEGRITVAVKQLDQKSSHGQGQREFLMEITMLSRYQHKNLVTLLGFCDENDEMILVYEHEFHGSLDKHLSNINLTWSQRLKISHGAACGLLYLHNPDGGLQRVLHRDIKSSNILLDQMGEAKISDFGLAKLGPAHQLFTFLVTAAAGTPAYCDPLYIEEGILTKESDVYSFGVVLFEVLCGRLCLEKYDDDRRFLTRLAKQSYKQNKMDDIIFSNIKEQMDPNSLAKFSAVAYRCLRKARKERPKMVEVVKELEVALDFQEKWDVNVVRMEGSSTGLSDLQAALSMFKQYKLKVIAQLRGDDLDTIRSIAFDRDDELLATAGYAEETGCIKVFNFSKIVDESLVVYHPLVDIQTSSGVYFLSWNKDTKNHIASGDEEGTVTVWDLNNKQSVMEYKEHEKGVFCIDFSCTEPSLLVSGGEDHKVGANNGCCQYYDLRNTSHPVNILTGDKNCVTHVRFLSNNELLYASADNTLRLWDINQYMLVRTYEGPTDEKFCVGLFVNNDFMACGSETNELFVYHKAFSKPVTCHALASPFAENSLEDATFDPIEDVCWKRDGSTIVAGFRDGTVQVLSFEAQRGLYL